MRMLFLVGFLVVASVSLLEGQTPDPWDVVQSLPAGEDGAMLRIRVEEGRARGRLISVDADGLTLLNGRSGERRFDRAQIRTVRLRPRGNAPVWGTLAGLGLGLPNAALADVSAGERLGALVLPVAGGWLIGTVVKNGKTRTIYQAP